MDNPNYKDSIYLNVIDDLQKMEDVTTSKGLKQEKYLIKFDGENYTQPTYYNSPYYKRLQQAEFNNAVNETIEIAVGKLFRKNISFSDDTDKSLLEWSFTVDGNNTTLKEFAKNNTKIGIRDGLIYTLIDVPYYENLSSLTNAEIKKLDLEPKLRPILFKDIINRVIDDKGNLIQVTILENVTKLKEGSRFENVNYNQYRVLYISGNEVYQDLFIENENKLIPISLEQKITPTDNRGFKIVKIPLIPLYINRVGYHNATPPLLEQANLVISWFNKNSQYNRALEKTGDPTIVRKGAIPNELGEYPDLFIGADSVIDVTSDGNVEFLELNGNSLSEFREKLSKLEEQIDKYKTSILERKAGNVTSKLIEEEATAKTSQLNNWALAIEDWLDNVLQIVGAYKGIEYIGSVTISKDFTEYEMNKDKAQFLSDLVVRGQLPLKTFLRLLKDGEILPDDIKIDELLTELENQSPIV